ncbi:hypothetical protein FRB93_009598 [Tulasnella sp. JGI-2019a]|nr:hypothetical protein FRB93_009598 [Tulasnella sp. JGI-2019a]
MDYLPRSNIGQTNYGRHSDHTARTASPTETDMKDNLPPPPPPKDTFYSSSSLYASTSKAQLSQTSLLPSRAATQPTPTTPRSNATPKWYNLATGGKSPAGSQTSLTLPQTSLVSKPSKSKFRLPRLRKRPSTDPGPPDSSEGSSIASSRPDTRENGEGSSQSLHHDDGISSPWGFQHNVHVDDRLKGLPAEWANALLAAGYSVEEVNAIYSKRQSISKPKQSIPSSSNTTPKPNATLPKSKSDTSGTQGTRAVLGIHHVPSITRVAPPAYSSLSNSSSPSMPPPLDISTSKAVPPDKPSSPPVSPKTSKTTSIRHAISSTIRQARSSASLRKVTDTSAPPQIPASPRRDAPEAQTTTFWDDEDEDGDNRTSETTNTNGSRSERHDRLGELPLEQMRKSKSAVSLRTASRRSLSTPGSPTSPTIPSLPAPELTLPDFDGFGSFGSLAEAFHPILSGSTSIPRFEGLSLRPADAPNSSSKSTPAAPEAPPSLSLKPAALPLDPLKISPLNILPKTIRKGDDVLRQEPEQSGASTTKPSVVISGTTSMSSLEGSSPRQAVAQPPYWGQALAPRPVPRGRVTDPLRSENSLTVLMAEYADDINNATENDDRLLPYLNSTPPSPNPPRNDTSNEGPMSRSSSSTSVSESSTTVSAASSAGSSPAGGYAVSVVRTAVESIERRKEDVKPLSPARIEVATATRLVPLSVRGPSSFTLGLPPALSRPISTATATTASPYHGVLDDWLEAEEDDGDDPATTPEDREAKNYVEENDLEITSDDGGEPFDLLHSAFPQPPSILVNGSGRNSSNSGAYDASEEDDDLPLILMPLARHIRRIGDGEQPSLVEPVAEGRFGVVFAAHPTNKQSRPDMVAVKTIGVVSNHQPKFIALQKELELLQDVKHNNILAYDGVYLVRDPDVQGGLSLWLQMELLDSSLADVLGFLADGLAVGEPAIARFACDVLQGLDYLQNLNIAHRDVRSDNLLLSRSGVLKLSDFSNATQIRPTESKRSSVYGQPPYWMDPEMRRGQPYDPYAADIWSVGATVWEVVEGDPPFINIEDTKNFPDRWPPLSAPEDYSPELEEFLSQCSQPAKRRPRADKLLQSPFVQSAGPRSCVVDLLKQVRALERATK